MNDVEVIASTIAASTGTILVDHNACMSEMLNHVRAVSAATATRRILVRAFG
ncbi:MAG: hypothetical protein CLLPBCKN_006948 [Chroococcidiopsis cubana SAG 39.79]|nr:hypothetical protein [Chroococcidiopsis cubana SAG 39.79]